MADGDPVPAFYGRWARLYDRLATLPGVDSWRAAAADELALASGDAVAEMGCGTGANLPGLRERVGPGGRVVGLDLTREMLSRARGRGGADLVQGDATRPPLSGGLDGLLATFVVAMFPDPEAAVERWCDLVAPGGRVALLHFSPSDRRWAGPVNGAYETLVELAAPGERGDRRNADAHAERVQRAHDALAARTTDYRERRLAGGYLRLAGGTVREE